MGVPAATSQAEKQKERGMKKGDGNWGRASRKCGSPGRWGAPVMGGPAGEEGAEVLQLEVAGAF